MTGVSAEDWACVAVFGFADGEHERHVLHRGPQATCERLAESLASATAGEAMYPERSGRMLAVERPRRLLRYPGARPDRPVGSVVTAVPVARLEEDDQA